MDSTYSQIYLDYNATTPCDQRVVDKMLPFFNTHFGNASSEHHPYGWMAKDAIEEATGEIAKILGVSAKELVYTSGSTESINQVLKGIYKKNRKERNHIITTRAEHKAVLDVCATLEAEGARITYLDVTANGKIDPDQLKAAISKDTLVVAVMYANNETGVIQELDEISHLCKANGSLLFSDATQALGKISLDTFFEKVDFACFSGHKIYGPKGTGITFIRKSAEKFLDAFIDGGGQQRQQRGGTYNTPGIIGMAEAVRLVNENFTGEVARVRGLRDRLEEGLRGIEQSVINGKGTDRLPNTLNMSFKYVDGEGLLRGLSSKLAVSNGSACNSANVNPSHVLTAMGVSESLAFASLRFSLGRYTTLQDVENTISLVTDEVERQRASNILWERRQQ